MKKILGGLVLSGLLASCGGGNSYFNVSNFDVVSQYYVQNATLNDGTVYSGDVICDDRTTGFTLSFNYSGSFDYATGNLRGVVTGQTTTLGVDSNSEVVTSNSASVNFYKDAGTVPLSVSPRVRPQAIIPTPVQQYNVIGATYVQLTAYSTSGVAQVLESAAIPVLDNCSF